MSVICIGADIGQKVDPTAIVVSEYQRVEITPAGVPIDETGLAHDMLNLLTGVEDPPLYDTRYIVRAMERLPLKTPYPVVARRLNGIGKHLVRRNTTAEIYLVVDATGVGGPVVDILKDELDDAVHLTAVTINGTDRLLIAGTGKRASNPLVCSAVTMGKVYMVSRLQALLQTRRIVMPDTEDARGLGKELADFEIKVSKDGHDEFGAFKTGTHDDLVTALGLSVLGEAHTQVTYAPSLY